MGQGYRLDSVISPVWLGYQPVLLGRMVLLALLRVQADSGQGSDCAL